MRIRPHNLCQPCQFPMKTCVTYFPLYTVGGAHKKTETYSAPSGRSRSQISSSFMIRGYTTVIFTIYGCASSEESKVFLHTWCFLPQGLVLVCPGIQWSLVGSVAVHTRQEGEPCLHEWPLPLATATTSSHQLSSRTGVWTRQEDLKTSVITIRPWGLQLSEYSQPLWHYSIYFCIFFEANKCQNLTRLEIDMQ